MNPTLCRRCRHDQAHHTHGWHDVVDYCSVCSCPRYLRPLTRLEAWLVRGLSRRA